MSHKFSIKGISSLESEKRKKVEDPGKLMDVINPGEAVTAGDIGCGTGYYSFPLAQRVGSKGKV